MLALLKRNFLLYFRNRSGVFFSLLGALISFILYIIFLQKNLTDAWAQLPNSGPLLNKWLPFSYLTSAIIISFAMQVLMYVLMCGYFREVPKLSILPELLLIMMLSSLLSSLVNAIFVYFFQSVDSLGKFSTIVGTASGFLVGTYVPLGVLPDFAQLLMKCTPATYIAALYRQVLMKETLSETFKGQDNLLQEFQEKMGVQLNWQGLLTKENTYLIVLGGILLASILWIVLVKRTSQKK